MAGIPSDDRLLGQLTDTHLVKLARFDDGAALDELDRRYGGLGARFAAAVTGRPADAAVVVREAMDRTHWVLVGSDAVNEPFSAVLLRSVRAVALERPAGPDPQQLAEALPADVDQAAVSLVFGGVAEPERSVLWLVEAAALDDAAVAATMDETIGSIRERLGAAGSALGSLYGEAVRVLSQLSVGAGDLPSWGGRARPYPRGRRPAAATSRSHEPLGSRPALVGAVVVLALASFGTLFTAGSDEGTGLVALPKLPALDRATGGASSPNAPATGGSSAPPGQTAPIDEAAKVAPNGSSAPGATNQSAASTPSGQPSGGSNRTPGVPPAGSNTPAPRSAAAPGLPAPGGSSSASSSRPAQTTSPVPTTATSSSGSSAASPPPTTRPAVSAPAPSSAAPSSAAPSSAAAQEPLVPLIPQVSGVVSSVVGGLLAPAGG